MDEMQAAFLNVKLPHLEKYSYMRSVISKHYLMEIKNNKIMLSELGLFVNHDFHSFNIRNQTKDKLQDFLLKNGIETIFHYLAL